MEQALTPREMREAQRDYYCPPAAPEVLRHIDDAIINLQAAAHAHHLGKEHAMRQLIALAATSVMQAGES